MIETPEATFCSMPMPNQRMNSGISATRGNAFKASMMGAANRSAIGNAVMSKAVSNASTAPSTKAMNTASKVIRAALGKVPSTTRSTKSNRNSEGWPISPRGRAPLCAAASQAAPQRAINSRRPPARVIRSFMVKLRKVTLDRPVVGRSRPIRFQFTEQL